jgi:hypothetical protein
LWINQFLVEANFGQLSSIFPFFEKNEMSRYPLCSNSSVSLPIELWERIARELDSLQDYWQFALTNRRMLKALWTEEQHALKRYLMHRMGKSTALVLSALSKYPVKMQQRVFDSLQCTPNAFRLQTTSSSDSGQLILDDAKRLLQQHSMPGVYDRSSLLHLILNSTTKDHISAPVLNELLFSALQISIQQGDRKTLESVLDSDRLKLYISANPHWFVKVLSSPLPAVPSMFPYLLSKFPAESCANCLAVHLATAHPHQSANETPGAVEQTPVEICQAIVQIILAITDDRSSSECLHALINSAQHHQSHCWQSRRRVHNEWSSDEMIDYAWLQASMAGRLSLIKLLVDEYRVDPRANDDCCFRWACRAGHLSIIEWYCHNHYFTGDDVEQFIQLAQRNQQSSAAELLHRLLN